MRKRLIFLLLMISLLGCKIAFACECIEVKGSKNIQREKSKAPKLEGADALFSGQVVALKLVEVPADSSGSFTMQTEVTFRVWRAWGGVDQGFARLVTGMGGGDCGFDFELSERYLVYALKVDGVLQTDICKPTSRERDAKQLVAALGPPIITFEHKVPGETF